MEFRKIDRSNYWECMELTVDDSQKDFVADNKQSLVEAAYEENLYTLGIYCQDTMVGFILYDYDDQIPGWSMSRFMIGKQYQGKGYGKQAALEFLVIFTAATATTFFSSAYPLKIPLRAKCIATSDFRRSKRWSISFWARSAARYRCAKIGKSIPVS